MWSKIKSAFERWFDRQADKGCNLCINMSSAHIEYDNNEMRVYNDDGVLKMRAGVW